MKVSLTASEVLVAGFVGYRRNAEAQFRGRKNRFPERYAGELWGNHIEAAHAELVVAKALGIYWGFGVNTFHTPDIAGTDIEVRWSGRNDLKVRPDDSGVIVSVRGTCPHYEIMGWIYAPEGQDEKYKFNKEPVCFFVPHSELREFPELQSIMRDRLAGVGTQQASLAGSL